MKITENDTVLEIHVNEDSQNYKGEWQVECGEKKFVVDYSIREITTTPLYRDFEWLRTEYVDKGRSMQSIADQFGLTPMSIFKWLKKHGIETRPPGRFAES